MAYLRNNYIIGLGGTGGASVAAFRRALALRHNEANELDERGVRFRYLYIDSNGTDIHAATSEADTGKWAIPGKSVHLEEGDCLNIDGSGFTMEQARMQANIAPWYGDTIGVDKNLGQDVEGASQRRRYGRMWLARRAGELKSRLSVGKDELTRGSKLPNSVTYHIFATLGGGTGSGCIVDLVAYLYATAVDVDPVNPPEIYLYLYVGGGDNAVKAAAVNTNLLFMNEYSALRDLNALMARKYKPDMALSPNGDESYLVSSSPIKSVFISSEQSERKLVLVDQIDNMANACLDIISLYNSQGFDSNNGRPFSGEDLVDLQPGEISSDATWDTSQQREPIPGELCDRSYRFQTISVSRCKEPEREIKTILKCALAEHVIIRLLKGDENQKYYDYADNPDIYKLDEPIVEGDLELYHQKYKKGIIEEFENKYNPQAIEFEPDTLKELTRDTLKQVQTIQDDAILDSQESSGADTAMQKRCKAEAAKLVAIIEAKLKDRRDWSKSPVRGKKAIWGIDDIITYLTNLTKKLTEEINNKFTFSQTYGNLEKRHSEWNKICGLTHLTKKQEEMYELHYQEALAIIKRACKEREDLIRRLVWKALKSELLDLIKKMVIVKDDLSEQIAKQIDIIEKTKAIINVYDKYTNISYIYDKEALDKHRSYYVSKESYPVLSQYMIELDEKLHTEGERPLNQCIPNVDDLDNDKSTDPLSFWNKSGAIHEMLYETDSKNYKRAYHDNIYEALKELKKLDAKTYDKKLESLRLNLAPSASLDPSPMGGNGVISNFIPSPYKAIQFGRPSYNNVDIAKEIDANVSKKISHMASDSSRYATFDLNDKHELRILYTIYWMPVRFFSFMSFLHKEYHRDNLDESRRKTNLYYSNIDDKDDQKPVLVPQNVSPRAHACRLYFTIATQLIVTQLPDSSEHMLAYEKETANGVEYHVYSLGEDKKLDTEMIHYEKYTANQMAEGSDALYQHLQNAVHAWFALAKADPQAVLNAMTEKNNEMREKTGKKHSREKELQYAAYNKFKELISYFSTL